MSEKSNGNMQSLGGLLGSSLLFAALGYYFYGGIDGFMGMIIFSGLIGLSLLLSLIPFGGFLIQFCIVFGLIIPYVFDLTGINHSILTWIITSVYLVIGLILNSITTYATFNKK